MASVLTELVEIRKRVAFVYRELDALKQFTDQARRGREPLNAVATAALIEKRIITIEAQLREIEKFL